MIYLVFCVIALIRALILLFKPKCGCGGTIKYIGGNNES